MLVEYALIPDIFEVDHYESSAMCDLRLKHLKQELLEAGVVRNLRNGAWLKTVWQQLRDEGDRAPHKAKELLRKLADHNRFRCFPAIGSVPPESAEAWAQEAIASHNRDRLTGTITTRATLRRLRQPRPKPGPKPDPVPLAAIDQLDNTRWWQARSPNLKLPKRTAAYLQHLRLVFAQANSLIFIDPYLDPSQRNFSQFAQLLAAIDRPADPPHLELHVATKGAKDTQGTASPLTLRDWRDRFGRLLPTLQAGRLRAEIFVWEAFHDRFLITDTIGINLNSGFDVWPKAAGETLWHRLDRTKRDQVQREFSANSLQHRLCHSFILG